MSAARKLADRVSGRIGRLVSDEVPAYLQAGLAVPTPSCIIFAQGRTGTWLLHSLLNQHPDLHFDKEILERRVLSPKRYLLGKARSVSPKLYGCHIQINQLLNTQSQDPARFMGRFADLGWRVVYLKRDDIVRQSISAILAVQRGQWVARQEQPQNAAAIAIDIDRVTARIRRRKLHLEMEAKILASIPHMSLVYEKDLQNPSKHQPTADRVFRFCGVNSVVVTAETHRITPAGLEGVISNFDQLMDRMTSEFPELIQPDLMQPDLVQGS